MPYHFEALPLARLFRIVLVRLDESILWLGLRFSFRGYESGLGSDLKRNRTIGLWLGVDELKKHIFLRLVVLYFGCWLIKRLSNGYSIDKVDGLSLFLLVQVMIPLFLGWQLLQI